MSTDGLQVRFLESTLEPGPVAPRLFERHAKDPAELRGVIRLGAVPSRDPPDERFGGIVKGEEIHEPRAVEIRVRLEPKIHLRQFGRQPQRVVEAGAVFYHRAEYHLVVRPLGATQST